MVEQKNEIFDEVGKFKKIDTPINGIDSGEFCYWHLVCEPYHRKRSRDDPETPNKLYGFVEIRTKDSVFAELSESINLEKLSKQMSQLMETATEKLSGLGVVTMSGDFSDTIKSRISSKNFRSCTSDPA